MATTDVNEMNASRYGDNFAILCPETGNLFGCEHNQQEAEAIARWISGSRGRAARVQHNSPDEVRAAHALRPDYKSEPIRYQLREEALTDMGVWSKPRRRRSRA